jgi:hypothetical protein
MYMIQAHLYEQCNEVYKDLVPLYEEQRQYKQLSAAHLHLHQVFNQLKEAVGDFAQASN